MPEDTEKVEEPGSASGAIMELKNLGAVEGVHFRIGGVEELRKYSIAVDRGRMVDLVKPGFGFRTTPDFEGVAVLNHQGMDLVGCPLMARAMRTGELPAEVIYVVIPDDV